jgi:hypothetical protein
MAICPHDRDDDKCPYCPAMRRARRVDGPAVSAIPDSFEPEVAEVPLAVPARTRGGRASLDEWDADDSASDGLNDLYQQGIRSNPRETGQTDTISDLERDLLDGRQ